MQNTDYDPKKFNEDIYGNLIPKKKRQHKMSRKTYLRLFTGVKTQKEGWFTKTIIEAYVKKESYNQSERLKIEKRIEQRKAQIIRLQKKLYKLGWVSWIDEILKPIAEALVKKMPDRYFDILGPFGMNCNTSIHFYKEGTTNKNQFEGDNCKSITFRPRNLDIGELVLVDYSGDTHQYKEGAIAELNGGNYRTVPMKESIDELFNWMHKQEKVTV